MALGALEKLSLGKQLSNLMLEQKTATSLQRLKLGQQIIEVMRMLGFGAKQVLTSGDGVKTPEQEIPPSQNDASKAPESVPGIVSAFLAGNYLSSSQSEFLEALRGIAGYVGQFLTFEDAKNQSQLWIERSGYTL